MQAGPSGEHSVVYSGTAGEVASAASLAYPIQRWEEVDQYLY